ncbi:polymorphic toxin type 30 domain-containing protein [Streptomyces sp. NPDC057654]|uniref:polymorphic toxin type 30 domain-containing protein n=1 Tax=Streptomyces sp. NPDC057654 TaxID=3346196 RepID=UPI0036839AA0
MSIEDEAKKILLHLGMWWPDANSGTLRHAADAWRTFADSVDDVRSATNNSATSLIHNNTGEAIDAFQTFWERYAKGADGGWLSDLAKASRKMAKALDKFADTVDDAITALWEQIGIDAVAIAGGVLLTLVSGGASDEAAAGIIELAAGLGVEVEASVAAIAAGMLTGAVYEGVFSMTIDAAVAQPVRIALGQQHGFSLDEVSHAAETGMIWGGLFGAVGPVTARAGQFGGYKNLLRPDLRPNLIEEGPFARPAGKTPCKGEPVDVATGAMLMTQTDVELPGSLPLLFERTHLSSYRAGTCFGPTWVSTLDETLQLDAKGVVFAAADGMRLVYPVPRPGEAMLPSKGARWPLEWDGAPDGVITVTNPHTGVVRTFSHIAPSAAEGAVQLPVESWSDRNGARMDVERTAEGHPSAIRHSGGYYLAVDTDGPRITALRLLDEAPSAYEQGPPAAPAGGTVVMRYAYDASGNLTEVVNSSGKPLRFTYDSEDRITSWTDRNGTSFAYVYDGGGRVIRTEGSDGVFNGSFAYDDTARTTTYTDSLGRRTNCRYNADGQVIAETDPLGHVTLTEWDGLGENRLSTTDPLGRTTRYAYDESGNLTELVLPDGSSARAEYDAGCRPLEVVEPGGTVWRHTYDDRGNVLTTTDPAGAETRYAYDAAGHLASVTNALGHTRTVSCDAAGLPTAVTDALGHTTTVARDSFGRVTESTDPLGHTMRMAWTTEGKPSRRELPDGTHETWRWDGEGNLLAHTDPAGNTTHQTSTHFDVPETRTDPDGTRYAFAYDTELRLTGVTNPQGLTWSYAYDEAGRLASETDFNGRTLTYGHDAAGGMVSRTNGAGETLSFERDALGRVVEQRGGADGDEITSYAYDAAGALVGATNADAELVIERDALGRVLAESVNGRTTGYAYDALGRRTRRVTPTGLTSEWTYDEEDRATALRSDAGTLTFAYDAVGRETERSLAGGATLKQTWDKNDRLTTQTIHSPQADSLLQHRSYAYRPDGYLTEIRELTSGTSRFDLDAMGRITGVNAHGWTERYAYDGSGNLTQAEAPAHETPGAREFSGTLIRSAGRTTYQHDAQGRLTQKTRKLLNGQIRTWTYRWSSEDRLVEAETPNNETWRYRYDPLGRRIAKQRLAEDGEVAEETTFTWDESRLAEQLSPTGRATTWDYAPNTHRPLTQTDHRPLTREQGQSLITKYAELSDPTETTSFHAIITDLVGTPTELITSAGEVAWQRRTTLWGTRFPAPQDSTTVDCPLRFSGQYADMETGLHYNYFRYYDPETARYATPDPLGINPAPNHHAYVRNPHTWADDLGLEGCPKRIENGGWDLRNRNPTDIVPSDAQKRTLTPDSNGGAQAGVEYKWTDSKTGNVVRMRIHGPDGNAPAGSNAHSGDVYRISIGGKYQDVEGNLYHRQVHNPNSPHYNPSAANGTHVPWPSNYPLPY